MTECDQIDAPHGASQVRDLDEAGLDTVVGGAPSQSHCEPDDGSGSSSSGEGPKLRPVLMVISNQDFWY